MKPTSLCLVLTLLSGAAYAQALTENAAAAAGATVGTAGGKVLSNVLDQTLSKAAAGTPEAAPASVTRTKGNKPASSTPLTASPSEIAPPARLESAAPLPPAPARRTRAAVVAPAQPAFVLPEAPVFAPAPPPTVEDFARVKEGGARQDVFAALGTPSSHITIPDEGHLIEILSYSDGRRRVGTVRLDNGQVISVTTAP